MVSSRAFMTFWPCRRSDPTSVGYAVADAVAPAPVSLAARHTHKQDALPSHKQDTLLSRLISDDAVTLTDDAVNAMVDLIDPHAARELRREGAQIEAQRQRELELHLRIDYAPQDLPPTRLHWAEELFTGYGLYEICSAVKPLLSERQYATFCYTLVDGKSSDEIAEVMQVSRRSVSYWRKQCRQIIIAAFPELSRAMAERLHEDDAAVAAEAREAAREEILALMQPETKTYRAPQAGRAVLAYVCPCGHHLSWKNKSHHAGQVDAIRCPCCRRVWPRSRWSELLT